MVAALAAVPLCAAVDAGMDSARCTTARHHLASLEHRWRRLGVAVQVSVRALTKESSLCLPARAVMCWVHAQPKGTGGSDQLTQIRCTGLTWTRTRLRCKKMELFNNLEPNLCRKQRLYRHIMINVCVGIAY